MLYDKVRYRGRTMSLPNVGMIGLGIMGAAMSANLIRAGLNVTGYDVLMQRRRDHQQERGAAAGAGSKMKFVANLLVAIHNVAAAEALVFAMKAGLDPADGPESGGRWRRELPHATAVGAHDGEGKLLEPNATMKVQVWQKDMTIIGDFARKLDCPTPLFSASAPIYTAVMAIRNAEDREAVCAVLEQMANCLRRPARR
jgi:3-hydroxyisobutyrate dehydrogenase-like beta-hydroxyacid dehydrogenase